MAITEGRGAHGSSESIAAGPPERPEVPPPPPPRTPAFRLERRPTLRGDIAAQCTGTLFQLMIVRKQWARASTFEARLVPAFSLAYFASFLLFLLSCPRAYWRNRTWLLPLHMVGIALTPWHNRIDAALGLLLAQPPQPGPVSCFRDVLRLAAGTRGATMLIWTCLVMHPPLAALLAHGSIALLAWNPLYCTTAALSAPLARERQAALARLLDALCVPLAAVQPIVGQLPTSFKSEAAMCQATTGWFHLVVQLFAPLFYNVWLWRPPGSSGSSNSNSSSSDSSTSSVAARVPPASCSGVAGLVQRAAATSDRMLHRALGGGAGWPVRLMVAYYVLANAWLICRV